AFLTVGLRREVALDRPGVVARREPDEMLGRAVANERGERRTTVAGEGGDGGGARAGERGLGHPSDAPQAADGEGVEERAHRVRRYPEETVRLPEVARDLRDHLPGRDADRHREAGRGAHAVLQEATDRERRPEKARGRGRVDERLVERERLDVGAD